MPLWLLLVLVVAGFSAVVPLLVLGITGGRWRVALTAWRQYVLWLAALAVPGALAWLALSIWPPIP